MRRSDNKLEKYEPEFLFFLSDQPNGEERNEWSEGNDEIDWIQIQCNCLCKCEGVLWCILSEDG